jgi:type II secretory pathway pseudopilin PulG
MRRQKGWTLVATMATLVIMALLAVALFKGSSMFGSKAATARKDGKGTTVLGAAEWAAKDDVCLSNLGQVRSAIQVASSTDADGKFPATLADTHIGSDFYRCPIGHEAYVYDSATGVVHCVHPGHEKY